MDAFSISQLQQFSGVKAHTIRIWEQRYNALQPSRSEGNTRYYSGSQLRRLLNIVSLMHTGSKVSELCTMADAELYRLVEEQGAAAGAVESQEFEYYVSQLIAAAVTYDEMHFDKIFMNALMRYGMRNAYVNIVYPTLVRVSLMWQVDLLPPAQEHFISHLFRQKFLSAADALPPPGNGKEVWLLFLAEDEFHEMGLLFVNYLLRLAGKKVIYLGPNVPLASLAAAAATIQPTHLLCFLVRKNDEEHDASLITQLCRQFATKKIYTACTADRLVDLKKPKNLTLLHSVHDLELALNL